MEEDRKGKIPSISLHCRSTLELELDKDEFLKAVVLLVKYVSEK